MKATYMSLMRPRSLFICEILCCVGRGEDGIERLIRMFVVAASLERVQDNRQIGAQQE